MPGSDGEVHWQTDMLTHTSYAVWILPLFCRTTHWRWKIHQLPGNLWGELTARQVNTKHTRGNTRDWADWKHVKVLQNFHLNKDVNVWLFLTCQMRLSLMAAELDWCMRLSKAHSYSDWLLSPSWWSLTVKVQLVSLLTRPMAKPFVRRGQKLTCVVTHECEMHLYMHLHWLECAFLSLLWM